MIPMICLRAGTVFDGHRILTDAAVFIEEDRVAAVKTGNVRPRAALVVDLGGRLAGTVHGQFEIVGFSDVHGLGPAEVLHLDPAGRPGRCHGNGLDAFPQGVFAGPGGMDRLPAGVSWRQGHSGPRTVRYPSDP